MKEEISIAGAGVLVGAGADSCVAFCAGAVEPRGSAINAAMGAVAPPAAPPAALPLWKGHVVAAPRSLATGPEFRSVPGLPGLVKWKVSIL